MSFFTPEYTSATAPPARSLSDDAPDTQGPTRGLAALTATDEAAGADALAGVLVVVGLGDVDVGGAGGAGGAVLHWHEERGNFFFS